jgi:hypothetical protein
MSHGLPICACVRCPSFNGSETRCLPWNVSAAVLQEALLSATANDPYTRRLLVTRSARPSDDGLWGSGATPAPNGFVCLVGLLPGL